MQCQDLSQNCPWDRMYPDPAAGPSWRRCRLRWSECSKGSVLGSVDKDAQFLQVFPGATINRAKFLGLLMGLECHLDLD